MTMQHNATTMMALINERGGLLEPSDLLCADDFSALTAVTARHYHLCRKFFIDNGSVAKTPFTISIGRSQQFGGASFSVGSIGMIFLNVASFFIAPRVFHQILGHPGRLSDIGDPSAETGTSPAELPPVASPLSSCLSDIQIYEPNNTIRRDYAALCSGLSLDYLFLHEFAHVLHGHTDFVAARWGRSSIEERISTDGDPRESFCLDMQTLEMDADSVAAGLLYTEVMHGLRNGQLLGGINTAETALSATAFTIAVLFRLMEPPLLLDDPKLKTRLHPPANLRANMASVVLLNIATRDGIDEAKAVQAIGGGLMEAMSAFRDVFGAHLILENELAAPGGQGSTYMERLLRHWCTIRPEIELYLRGGTLAPCQFPPRAI